MSKAVSIAIIGIGPKGLYSLERLLAELAAQPLNQMVEIHCIHSGPHLGVSPIYAEDLPDYILINNPVGDIDVWSDDLPPPIGGRGPNFVNWYNAEFKPEALISGDEYLPRRLVGEYLKYGFEHLQQNIPHGLKLICHDGEAQDIQPQHGRYLITVGNRAGEQTDFEIVADRILLATGHSSVELTVEEAHYCEFANTYDQAKFVPFVYPIVETLKTINARSSVAIKGMGSTFIDAVIELSEGRGGRFEQNQNGVLEYFPSGNEPQKIFGFCRSGLPLVPKSADLPLELRSLVFVTPANIAMLRRQSNGRQLVFDSHLWPLFELEMERVYYEVIMGRGEWLNKLNECAGDAKAMQGLISSFRAAHPEVPRFDYQPLIDPLHGLHFDSNAEYNQFLVDYMQSEITRAFLGQKGSPLKAALDVWFEVRYAISEVVQFSGLTPESHKRVKSQHLPILQRLVFGPPIINAQKLLALVRAGIVDLGYAFKPQVITDLKTGQYQLRCSQISNAVACADVLIDARYPDVDISVDSSELFKNLLRRDLIRPLDNSGYQPGAIDMTPDHQFIINGKGIANKNISVTGIPTEGNLLGNKTVTRSVHHRLWANDVVESLRREGQTE